MATAKKCLSTTDIFSSVAVRAYKVTCDNFANAAARKACKSLALGSWFTSFPRVLPTSRVGYPAGKPIESVVYCLIKLALLNWMPLDKYWIKIKKNKMAATTTLRSRWASEDHIHTNINSTWRILFSTCLPVSLHVFSGIPRGIPCYLNLAE